MRIHENPEERFLGQNECHGVIDEFHTPFPRRRDKSGKFE